MAANISDEALAYGLALDVCDQWKLENGYKTLSTDDLMAVRKWMGTPRATISRFPDLQALAAKGIDNLIAKQHRASPAGAGLRRI